MRRLEGIPAQPLPRPLRCPAGKAPLGGPQRPAPRPTPRAAPPKRDVEFKPYQLKTKKKQECKELPDVISDPKKLKRMKKKLDELNRKIRHSRKKHNGLIHKRNTLRKAIESAKHGTEPQ